MSFIESPRFPEYIAYGASGGPEFLTEIVTLDSGFEQRNARWQQSRSRYTITSPLPENARASLIAFFRAVQGRAHGFRLRDWADYAADATNGYVGETAVGAGIAGYQLYKRYVSGLVDLRAIKKPVAGTVTIYRNGVAQVAGVGAGNYAIDTATGIVSFVADGTRNVTGVSIAASAVITLATALTGTVIGSRLFLSGVGGSVGAVLNGIAHVVTAVSGAQYTVSTSTVGSVFTAGGVASRFPQISDALTWAGEFDVPVRFDIDYLTLTIEAPKMYRAQSVQMIEIRTL